MERPRPSGRRAELLVALFVVGTTIAAFFLTREPDPLRETVGRIRAHWPLPQGQDPEDVIRREFGRFAVHGVRVDRRFEVGDHLESDDGEFYGQFKPSGRFGGSRNMLTPGLVQELRGGEGIVFLEGVRWVRPPPHKALRPQGWCLLFTLPEDGQAFSYVTVRMGSGVPGWVSSELEATK